MRIIKYNKQYSVGYPVGEDFQYSLTAVNQYYNLLVNNFKTNIKDASRVFILMRGSSGAILGSLLANKLYELNSNISLGYYRKGNEYRHGTDGGFLITNSYSNPFVILVDDFIDSGKTVNAVIDEYFNKSNKNINCIIVQSCHMNEFSHKNEIDCLITSGGNMFNDLKETDYEKQ